METMSPETEAALKIFDQFVFAGCLTFEEKLDIINDAASLGKRRAGEIRQEFGKLGAEQILNRLGIQILEETEKTMSADYVKFAEYSPKAAKIRVNGSALKKIARKMEEPLAREIILCHELYHCLEYSRWGDTSSLYVRNVKLFGRIPAKRRMLPAAEIAANSFTKSFLGLDFEPQIIETYYFQ